MALEIKLHLPDHVYQRMAQYASAHEQDIQTAIVAYLEQHLPDNEQAVLQTDGDVGREVAAFHTMHEQLQEQYEGEYVAILDGQLIDHDLDRQALFQRINQQYPDTFVLMRPVEPKSDREFQFRSPRLEQRDV